MPGSRQPKRHSLTGPTTVGAGLYVSHTLTPVQLQHRNFRIAIQGTIGDWVHFVAAADGVADEAGSDKVLADDNLIFSGESYFWQRKNLTEVQVTFFNPGAADVTFTIYPFVDGEGQI